MKTTYRFFSSREIRPSGWMKRQLEIQAAGLAGNLDRVWPDIRDSKWAGGDREGWERVPYWLDGFIPLAYLLDDEDMKQRAKRYINSILANQQPNGWICPNGDTPIEKYDTWAVMLIAKVMTVYYDCSADERIPEVLYRLMKNYHELLSSGQIRLFDWAKARWYEAFIALNCLRKRWPDEAWILELANILRNQGTDYSRLTDRWKVPLNRWTHETHIVNLCMMLKSEAVSCEMFGERYTDLAERLYQTLSRYNRMPVGTFTGDECLAGLSPIQGTELCGVVELMYSFEQLYAFTGDAKWAERLETVAFNALPAAISDDMWSHQYVQMSNQIDCTPFGGKSVFGTNNAEAHIFGLEPNFGCCTANFGQGWPKLTLSAFLKAHDGIISAIPVPATLHTVWEKVPVTIELETEYPFRNQFRYRVTAEQNIQMKLYIRLPSFAEHITLNGKRTERRELLPLRGFPRGTTEIILSYETTPKLLPAPHKLVYAKCGSLVFSLPIKSAWEKVEYTKYDVERKYPYCDYRVTGSTEWNYAYASETLQLREAAAGDVPFSSEKPRLTVTADVVPINWGYEPKYTTVCAKIPHSRKPIGEKIPITLIPYGCAKLRMTELPLVKE